VAGRLQTGSCKPRSRKSLLPAEQALLLAGGILGLAPVARVDERHIHKVLGQEPDL
jgi:hypothetical protein